MAEAVRDEASVEQAIYTWSSNNRGGGRGLGFGRVSPGLQSRVAWMHNAWPEHELDLMLKGVARSVLFEGWRQAMLYGSFAVGDQNVVYRKIADAGLDGHKRDRYLVHLLVGSRTVLDLGRVPADSRLWLTAGQCPLDGLPSLESHTREDLGHRRFDHDCNEHELVADVLARLVAAGGAAVSWDVALADLDPLLRAIHVAVPTGLWRDMQVASLLSATGVRCELRVVQREPDVNAVPEVEERVHAAGLDSCMVHHRVDGRWSRRGSRGWARWIAGQDVGLLLAGAAVNAPARAERPIPAATAPEPRGSGLSDPLRDIVRSVLNDKDWDYAPLSEQAFGRVIGASEMTRDTFAAWMQAATPAQLRSVLAGLSERRHFAIVKQYAACVDTAALQAAWQASVVAPIGFALGLRDDAALLPPGWAVPKPRARDHDEDTRRLAEQLITSARGTDAIIVLFRGGLLENRPWRNAWLRALLATDFSPDYVFGRLLSDSGADERALWEVTVDNIEAFTDWLKMPPAWKAAFHTGMTTKPRWLLRVLFHNAIAH